VVGLLETIRTCPIRMLFGLVIEFRVIKFLVVVPNRVAMPLSVSPLTTVYLLLGLGLALGVGFEVALIIRTCPTRMLLAFVIPFRLIRFLVVVPNCAAIPLNVSPCLTVYRLLGVGAAGEVLGVGLGDDAVGLGVGLGDDAVGLGVGLGDDAVGLGVGLGDDAVGLGVGLGDDAVGLGVGLGDDAVGLGVGLGEGVTRVSKPLTNWYFPNRAAIVYGLLSLVLRSANAFTCEPFNLTALAQFRPQVATSSQLANARLVLLWMKKYLPSTALLARPLISPAVV
jgi:hypothetical protein